MPAERVGSAIAAAARETEKALARAQLEAAQKKIFRKETLDRLKTNAHKRRQTERRIDITATAEKEARAHEIAKAAMERGAVPATVPAAPAVSEPTGGAEPSRLDEMRAGLAAQAARARECMMMHCEAPWATAQPPPTAPMPAPIDGLLAGVDALRLASPPPPANEAKSVLRAVTARAAHLDRLMAHEARVAKAAKEQAAARQAKVAAAAAAEREAERRTESRRWQVEQLELIIDARKRDEADAQKAVAAHAQKARKVEGERFYKALREQLQEEAATRKTPLPPLCACGLKDPLDNHTALCARNCIFYNNPDAYRRALSGLFVRPIVLD